MKVLIIKTSALGDIVQTFPAVQFIRKLYPDAVIDWVVEKRCADLVVPHVNRAILIDTKNWSWKGFKESIRQLRQENYDLIVDFQGNIKSGLIMGLARGHKKVGFGRKSVSEWPNLLFSNHKINPKPGLNIREDYLSLVESSHESSPSSTIKPFEGGNVLVCPGSNWENKRLSESTLLEFLKKIEQDKPCKFFITQSNEKEMAFAVYLKNNLTNAEVVPTLSLPALQNFMQTMDLVIAMDSLPLHLAAEANIPTFSVFGPSLAAKYKPIGPQHRSIQGACPYGQTFTKRCPLLRTCKTGACMKNITPEELFTKFKITPILYTPGKLEK